MKSSEYGDVYKQFDSDGDGDITPDELITVSLQQRLICVRIGLSDFGETWRSSNGSCTLLQRYE